VKLSDVIELELLWRDSVTNREDVSGIFTLVRAFDRIAAEMQGACESDDERKGGFVEILECLDEFVKTGDGEKLKEVADRFKSRLLGVSILTEVMKEALLDSDRSPGQAYELGRHDEKVSQQMRISAFQRAADGALVLQVQESLPERIIQ